MSNEVCQQQNEQCTDEFSELLCVTFEATFTVAVDCAVTGVECLGPCDEDEEEDSDE